MEVITGSENDHVLFALLADVWVRERQVFCDVRIGVNLCTPEAIRLD